MIRRWALIVSLLSAFGALAPLMAAPGEASTPEQQAEAAWAQRAAAGRTEKAFTLWIQAVSADPSNTGLWISAERAGARLTRHAGTREQKRRWADRTRDCAEKAVQQNPQSSEAYACLGEALGQWADTHKGIGSLKTVRRAVEALKKAVSLDPKNTRAHMLLSEFYRQAPSTLSVGDKAKALDEARLAVETGPQYAISHLALAEIYIDRGEQTAAAQELQTILALTPPPDAIPETRADQETARRLLKKLGVTVSDAAPLYAPGACTAADTSSGNCTARPLP